MRTLNRWTILIDAYCFHFRLSTLFNKPLYQGYTGYLDECCKVLLHDQEYANDSLLVQLVKIQRLSLKISTLFSESSDGMELTPQNYHTITISIIRKELDDWTGQLSNELKSNCEFNL